MSKFLQKNLFDLVFLLIFGICAAFVFNSEINNSAQSQLDNSLFSALEFGLSLGIGWILQRIASREEFQKNLKQFAFSAYRRISDIKKSVTRLDKEIERIRSVYPEDKLPELNTLKSITEMMDYTVQSSISDWSDIIGEEVQKLKEIEEKELLLEKTKALVSKQPKQALEDPDKLQQLNDYISSLSKDIRELKSNIPLSLQINSFQDRSEVVKKFIKQHFIDDFFYHGNIILDCTLFPNAVDKFIHKEKEENILILVDRGMAGQFNLLPFDSEFGELGEIVNTFSYLDVTDQDYYDTLLNVLDDRVEKIDGHNFPAKIVDSFGSSIRISVPAEENQLLGWG